jgi:hypothetical protein
MRRVVLLTMAILAVSAVSAGAVAQAKKPDKGAKCSLKTVLSAANEVPPNDGQASGRVKIRIRGTTLGF